MHVSVMGSRMGSHASSLNTLGTQRVLDNSNIHSNISPTLGPQGVPLHQNEMTMKSGMSGGSGANALALSEVERGRS